MLVSRAAHVVIPIALFQVVAVVIGVFMMRMAFLAADESVVDLSRYWLPLLVRHHGYLLLAVPLVWTGLVLWLEHRPGEAWSRRWTMASGLVLLAVLAGFLYAVCSNTYARLTMM